MHNIRPRSHLWILAALLSLSTPAWGDPGSPVSEPVGHPESESPFEESVEHRTGAVVSETERSPETAVPEDWNAHFQTTVVDQWHAPFRSAFSPQGNNSLQSRYEQAPSLTATVFLGKRLWEGGEFYLNPEMAGGYAVSHATGVAGFLNGEVTRISGNDPLPAMYMGRGFLRQTWNLGEEKERFESDQNSLAGEASVSRLTLTLGKMSALDIFDNNAYSHDPRTQFLNWSLMANGAWDYPADTRGYTIGATVEYNQQFWALRAGVFMEPKTANGIVFDKRVSQAHGEVVEGELRYAVLDQPGKLRLLAFVNQARMGNYRDTLNNPAFNLDVTQSRRDSIKYGFGLNAEQNFGEYLGGFMRLGWNDGKTETWAFTEIDRTASLGGVLGGALWGRTEDKFAVAEVVNGLSKDHRDYLAAGGYGFIVGDGGLPHYALEQVIEVYYAIAVNAVKGLTISPYYQHVGNPAYNADRGPVSVYSVRAHYQF